MPCVPHGIVFSWYLLFSVNISHFLAASNLNSNWPPQIIVFSETVARQHRALGLTERKQLLWRPRCPMKATLHGLSSNAGWIYDFSFDTPTWWRRCTIKEQCCSTIDIEHVGQNHAVGWHHCVSFVHKCLKKRSIYSTANHDTGHSTSKKQGTVETSNIVPIPCYNLILQKRFIEQKEPSMCSNISEKS